ncbi:MAG: hypothetical protein F6K16_41210, partial [Symploca sp. SIO2B6]|nr:hypothetical protein [Symploca sp. SIO2B6]
MLTPILDQLGDWNPQLLRELKGQLKWLKIGLAITLSVIVQSVFLVIMAGILPGSVTPKSLQVSTFPQIQLDYNYEETDNFRISYLSGTSPVENHPGYGTLLSNPIDLQVGDRILEVNGVSLGMKSDKQGWLDEQLRKPFAEDLENLRREGVLAGENPEAIAQRLRQEIPGQTVQLIIERVGHATPITVDVPRIVATHRTSAYCLPFDGKLWDDYLEQERHYDQHSKLCSVNVGQHQYRIDWTRWHQEAFWALSLVAIFP